MQVIDKTIRHAHTPSRERVYRNSEYPAANYKSGIYFHLHLNVKDYCKKYVSKCKANIVSFEGKNCAAGNKLFLKRGKKSDNLRINYYIEPFTITKTGNSTITVKNKIQQT